MKVYINKFLHIFEIMKVKTSSKVVYLTFDDGPEGEITNFVLDELKKYNAKGTFFCRGDNAEKNRSQLDRIIIEGHTIGNHSYSHLNSFNTPTKTYIENIKKADNLLKTNLFRPPWGSLTISAFFSLYNRYKIVYWSLTSGDSQLKRFDLDKNLSNLKHKTSKGDIILFHSCKIHERETKLILPLYLQWLYSEGYKCESL